MAMELSDRVTCSKCAGYFTLPRRLLCSCALCKGCIPNHSHFACPSCTTESRSLQFRDLILARPEHTLATIKRVNSPGEYMQLQCECCSISCRQEVVAWCSFPDCGFMCVKASMAHQEMKVLSRHSFYTMQDLRILSAGLDQPSTTAIARVPIQVARETFCYSHSRDVLNFYCMSCSEILCCTGAENHPVGHDIAENLNEVYLRLRCDEELKRLVEKAAKQRELIERQENTLESSSAVALSKVTPKLKALIKAALNVLDWIQVEPVYFVLIEYKRIRDNLTVCTDEVDELLKNLTKSP